MLITAEHKRSKGWYGAPRICAELGRQDRLYSRKRVSRLMRQAGLAVAGSDLPFRPRLPGYTSAAFAVLAEDCQVTLPVGRKGQCWDNAVAESFFASLKGELFDTRAWPTRAGACRAVVEYIAWHNGTPLRSSLGYRSPADFENDHEGTIRNVA